jgi:hypothetical protein
MNKIVYIYYTSLYMDAEGIAKIADMDKFMIETYGLECDPAKDKFTVQDESKFALFMLEHSQYIRKMVYE